MEHESFDHTGSFGIYPDFNASGIESQEVLNKSKSHFTSFFSQDVSFKGMFPSYGTEIGVPSEPHTICDMHTWVEKRPRALVYPVSPRFKKILDVYNIPELRCYTGSVLWRNKEHEFYVMHLLIKQFQYIDFSHSAFIECSFEGVKTTGSKIVTGNSMEELRQHFGAKFFTFERAVMNPEFRELDMYHVDIYGIVITERLKAAIESANLTGVKITECPIEFEFSDEI